MAPKSIGTSYPVACVTGATSGIGRAFAQALAAAGYNLIITGRRTTVLDQLSRSITEEHGVSVSVFTGDLSRAEVTADLAQRLAECSGLAFLVHNAGFGHKTRFFDTPPEDLRAMGEVHVQCAVELVRAAVPTITTNTTMADREGTRATGTLPPSVIFVSSLAAYTPLPAAAMYTATKGFLLSFGKALAPQLRRDGIAVQILCPGFTHTDFHDRLEWTAEQRRNRGIVRWMTADQVVRQSLRRLRRKRMRGNPAFIPGIGNRIVRALLRITPDGLYRSIAMRAEIDQL